MTQTDYLLLPRLRVQNANAISGPFTHGFPSITAFMGLMWALERKCAQAKIEIQFKAVGVIAHKTQELIAGEGYGAKAFQQMRRPVSKKGESAPMQEEGRMHLEFSLLFGVKIIGYLSETERSEMAHKILEILQTMRLAGGIFLPSALFGAAPSYKVIPRLIQAERFEKDWWKEKYRLLPGFALIERADLLEERFQALLKKPETEEKLPKPTYLEAFLSLCAVRSWAVTHEDGKVEWQSDRQKGAGWIVPISVGYGAIGPIHPAGSVRGARDSKTAFRAVESLQSIGEWRSPHRFEKISAFLWRAESDAEKGLYRCRNLESVFPNSEEALFVKQNDSLNFDD
ncbi:type I-F CRISPR-associated protein Csy2 [Acetobacteraceae bacterium]|nr:type I-F CRISPR-associated protein Csy2 [Acetobacteraceae bacterium]